MPRDNNYVIFIVWRTLREGQKQMHLLQIQKLGVAVFVHTDLMDVYYFFFVGFAKYLVYSSLY